MLRDGVISDELWDVLESVMPLDAGRRGRPWNDHRTTVEGIICRFRTGSPWRDLPETFGPYQSVWQRHRLWSTDGTYVRMLAAVREDAKLDGDEGKIMDFLQSSLYEIMEEFSNYQVALQPPKDDEEDEQDGEETG